MSQVGMKKCGERERGKTYLPLLIPGRRGTGNSSSVSGFEVGAVGAESCGAVRGSQMRYL